MEVTSRISVIIITRITVMPATNLPLITSSRWTGWASRRDSVPWLRSELIPSNPNAMPTSGTSSTTRAIIGMLLNDDAPCVNSARNTSGLLPLVCEAMPAMSLDEKYIGRIESPAMTISSTRNRQLAMWSASSLAAIVRQPPDGARSVRRDSVRVLRAGAPVVSAAAIDSLRHIAAIELQQIGAPPPQVRQREVRRRERGRQRCGHVVAR